MSINRHFLRDDPFDHIRGRRDRRTQMIIISHLSWDTKVARKLWGLIHSQQIKRKGLFSNFEVISSNQKHVTLTTIHSQFLLNSVFHLCLFFVPLWQIHLSPFLSYFWKCTNKLRDSFTNSTKKELWEELYGKHGMVRKTLTLTQNIPNWCKQTKEEKPTEKSQRDDWLMKCFLEKWWLPSHHESRLHISTHTNTNLGEATWLNTTSTLTTTITIRYPCRVFVCITWESNV